MVLCHLFIKINTFQKKVVKSNRSVIFKKTKVEENRLLSVNQHLIPSLHNSFSEPKMRSSNVVVFQTNGLKSVRYDGVLGPH